MLEDLVDVLVECHLLEGLMINLHEANLMLALLGRTHQPPDAPPVVLGIAGNIIVLLHHITAHGDQLRHHAVVETAEPEAELHILVSLLVALSS